MTTAGKPKRSNWTQDPDAVKADILSTATKVFAQRGYAGARVSEIVEKTRTSKRMIYYYFGDKQGLYLAVLEAAYARVRSGEDALLLDELDALSALTRLVEFTFDYHRQNPDYVRLVAIENIHHATHLAQSNSIPKVNMPAIGKLEGICRQGIEAGLFREDIDPVALHWFISSSAVFNVSNRATFEHLYGNAIYTDSGQESLKAMVVGAVKSVVLKNCGQT